MGFGDFFDFPRIFNFRFRPDVLQKRIKIKGFRPSSRQKRIPREKQPKLHLTRAPEDSFYTFSCPFPSRARQKKKRYFRKNRPALNFWGSWPGTKHPGGLLPPRPPRMRISDFYTWISQRILLYGMGMAKIIRI